MLKISFQLKKSTINKQGESPISIVLYENPTSKYAVRTGLFCPVSSWDKKRGLCKGNYERTNLHLNKLLKQVQTIEDRFVLAGESYTPQLVWENHKNPTIKIKYEKPVLEILTELNEQNFKAGKFIKKNYDIHKSNIRKITYFLTEKGLEKIGYDQFDISLFQELITTMRFLHFDRRKPYVSADALKDCTLKKIAQKVTEGNVYALQNKFTTTPLPSLPKFKNDDAITEFLTWEELVRFTDLDLSANKNLENVRDIFLFSCFTSFQWCDMKVFDIEKHLFNDENNKEWILKPRNKTKELQQIPMMPVTKALLEKWNNILPLGVEQTHNKEIKGLCKLAGITKRITNRCGRKTAAMVWINSSKGRISMESISKMIGHKSIRTTQKHYASIDNERLTRETDCLRGEIQTTQIVPQVQNIDLSNVLANLTAEIAKMNANNQQK